MSRINTKAVRTIFFSSCVFISFVLQAQPKEFKLKIDSYRGDIQWEQSNDRNIWTSLNNATSDSLIVTPQKTTYYRARVTESGCDPVYSALKGVFIDTGIAIPAKLVKGKIKMPAGSTINISELTVSSLIDEQFIKSDGGFELLTFDSPNEQNLVVTNKKGEAVMLGIFFSPSEIYEINSETTAMALLLTYPFLKPVFTSTKDSISKLYLKEPGFKQMVEQVESLNINASPLFSPTNDDLINSINTLVQKDYNSDRFRKQTANKIFADPIFIISKSGGKVTVSNSTSFHYAGSIYKKDGTRIGSPFKLKGSISTDNQFARWFNYLLTKEELNKTEDIDIKGLGLPPGEYEIRVRSGLADETTMENDLALKENLRELLLIFWGNILPSTADLLGGDENLIGTCIGAGIDNYLNTIPIDTLKQIVGNGTPAIIEDLVVPFFSDTKHFFNRDCKINIIFQTLLYRYLEYAKIIEKVTPIVYYITDWLVNANTINGCQYLDKEYETYNCFIIKPVEPKINEKYYSGDTAELKVVSRLDDKYYPYKDSISPFKHFAWVIDGNGGWFAPDSAWSAPDRTLKNGEAKIKWVMPCEEKNNGVRIVIPYIKESLTNNLFTTKSYHPKLKLGSLGDNQTGEPGQKLAKNLIIGISDELDSEPMLMKRFIIEWENVKGTGKIDLEPSVTPFDSSFSWTLGPEEGEQVVKATIRAKNCEWPMADGVILFRANNSPPDSTIFYQDAVVGKWIVSNAETPGEPPYNLEIYAGGIGKYVGSDGVPFTNGGYDITWSILKRDNKYYLYESGFWHPGYNQFRVMGSSMSDESLTYPITFVKTYNSYNGAPLVEALTYTKE